MNPILLAGLLALDGTGGSAAPAELDLRCYRLMSDLAARADPRARPLGMAAAHYFLGRIDAAAPGFDVRAQPALSESERVGLLPRCGAVLESNGFDLDALGRSLAQPEPSV